MAYDHNSDHDKIEMTVITCLFGLKLMLMLPNFNPNSVSAKYGL